MLTNSGLRYVSQITRNTLALILAGGKGSCLFELTQSQSQAKPALHFGGKVRVIDLSLSNSGNSDIKRIGLMIQYKAYSHIRHLAHAWLYLNCYLCAFIKLPEVFCISNDGIVLVTTVMPNKNRDQSIKSGNEKQVRTFA